MPVWSEDGEKFLWGLEKAEGIGGYPGPDDMLCFSDKPETFPHFANVGDGVLDVPVVSLPTRHNLPFCGAFPV